MFWKKEWPILVGLEIGTSKIACSVAELKKEGELYLLGIAEAPSLHVRKGEIVDFELAQKSIQDALLEAESKTNVEIKEVYLAVSGAHIRSFNSKVVIGLGEEGDRIDQKHLNELRDLVRYQTLPSGQVLLHDLLKTYYLDDGTATENPVGLFSKKLAAEYHLISGIATRLQTTIRCVKELSIDVRHYCLSIFATALAVLTRDQKKRGAIVIDLGAGLSDYIVYHRGLIVHSGVIGVGQDHLTNDLALALRIPFPQAEEIKRHFGSYRSDKEYLKKRVALSGQSLSEEKLVPYNTIVKILKARQGEIFEIIKEDLESQSFWPHFTGDIYLTGGGSMIEGIVELAQEIFGHPVKIADPLHFEGDQSYVQRPDLYTVLGLLRYARVFELENIKAGPLDKMRTSLMKILGNIKFLN
ncbi:cell division protein FtsA [Candidatus Methylacidiphilum infernorum]|uniref:Cell division protein FtsA n=1 Tax=Methylacidiphilum infernorum (isolate V4) TaxID=481448 RepID=B3DVV7_METI4|nr:cell division protein FtsA [Candidatus Methylacidiphilum infernorum]ACD83460.1 Cell division ATPase FtsA [Methylacidiphilum infernorum V4]